MQPANRADSTLIRAKRSNGAYYMASSASGQDEPNRALWLATRAGKMEPSCPLGTTHRIPHEKFPRKPYNKSFIDQVCSVKIVGDWPRSFFASLWTSTSSRSINTQKKNLANIQPSWPHTWSITYTNTSTRKVHFTARSDVTNMMTSGFWNRFNVWRSMKVNRKQIGINPEKWTLRYMKMLYVLAINCTQIYRVFCTSAAHSETYVKRTPSLKKTPTWVSKFSSHIYYKINLHSADTSVTGTWTSIKPVCCTKPGFLFLITQLRHFKLTLFCEVDYSRSEHCVTLCYKRANN